MSSVLLLFSIGFLKAQNPYGSVKNHAQDITIDYNTKQLFVESELTILNETKSDIIEIPFILYRLLKVTSVLVDTKPVSFNQEITSFSDFDALQVNAVTIYLNKAIPIASTKKIKITYEGNLLGYSETGLDYVKDHINANFTILRPDCLAYPIVGLPEFSSFKQINSERFNYTTTVTVPESLTVVNGGILTSKTANAKSTISYTYKSSKPTSQIVTTIAKYKKLTTGKISTFYFEKDSIKAKKVHQVQLNTFSLFSKWWGKLKGNHTFSLIEIPENYGSQATENYIVQTASAFNDANQLRQLYHEISHLWNVKSNDKYPTRYNEGLATFLEYKTVESLERREVLQAEVEKVFNRVKSNRKYSKIPLIDFGKENITDRSYTIGFLMFYVLHQIVGEEEFNQLIRSFYKEYYKQGATTNEFCDYLKMHSKFNLTELIDDWVYTTHYYSELERNDSIRDLIKTYKVNY